MAEPRDGWAKFDIAAKAFAAICLPVVLGVFGFCHNEAAREASRRDVALRDSLAALERQADRLAGLVEHLSSDSPRRRLMAIRMAEQLSLRDQLPREIVPILIALAQDSTDSAEQTAARRAVSIVEGGETRRDELIQRLFSDDAQDRIPASEALVRLARGDASVVPVLLEYASRRLDNGNGLYNTLGILVQICPAGTRQHRSQINSFLDSARQSPARGQRIQGLIDQLTTCMARTD